MSPGGREALGEGKEYTVEVRTALVDSEKLLEGYCDVHRFLTMCQECRSYGHLWSCPPFDSDRLAPVRESRAAYLCATRMSFPLQVRERLAGEEVTAFSAQVLGREKARADRDILLLEDRFPGSVALTAGSCKLCQRGPEQSPEEYCTRSRGQGCRCPERMRSSLEALGFDVARISQELLNTPLLWSRGELPEYYVLVTGLLLKEAELTGWEEALERGKGCGRR